MKRVLFIAHIFPPMPAGGAVRSGQFAKYLPSSGWAPTILTVRLAARSQVDREMLEELPREVSVIRTLSFESLIDLRGMKYKGGGKNSRILGFTKYLLSLLLIPDRQVLWFPMAFVAGCKALVKRHYQLIYATYRPATNLLLGYLLKKVFRKPLVIDFRDLWVDNPGIILPTNLHRNTLQFLEKRIVQAADKIVAVSEPMREWFAGKYGLGHDRVVAITNGYDPEDRQRFMERPLRRNRKFTVIYTGSSYGIQNPNLFLQSLSRIVAQDRTISRDLQVEFVGNLDKSVPAKYQLQRLVKTYHFVSHKKVLDFLVRADVLLLIINKTYCSDMGHSAKLFDYLITGNPILALTAQDSVAGRLLRDAGVGVTVDPEDTQGIQEAILELYEKWKNNALSVSPDQAVIDKFDRRLLTQQMAEVFNEVCHQKGIQWRRVSSIHQSLPYLRSEA